MPHSFFIECNVLPFDAYESIANKGFGADFERYSWVQTLNDVTILIPVNNGVRARDVHYELDAKRIYVSLLGEPTPILDGPLYQRINVHDSIWYFSTEDRKRYLQIELYKNEGPHWWPYVVEGEQPIDVSKIEPPPCALDEVDENVRSQVEKMMYEQSQKQQSPSKSDILDQFMRDHPELDFSEAKIQ